MFKTRQVYFCYTCSDEVTFRGTRIRYNLDGSLHLCKPDDKLAYDKYREYIRVHDKAGWHLIGEDFWKWKREIYDFQRWTQSCNYHDELKEREREEQRAAEEKHKADKAKAQRQKAAAKAAEEQRREQERKQASREKRRAARKRRKQREQAEAEAGAGEAKTREREHQAEQRHRRRSSRSSRRRESPPRPGGRLEEALKIMGLTVDILRLSSNETTTMIKNRFRILAMKFHPDRGGDANNFIAMNEAYDFLSHHLLNKI